MQKGKKMREIINGIFSLYSLSLVGFLIFIRKDFLHITGDFSMPSIDLNPDEPTENENQ